MPTDQQLAVAKREAARELQIRLARTVDPIVASLVQSYARAWQQIRDELLVAIAEAEAQSALLGQPGPAAIRTARLQRALDALTRQLQQLNEIAGVTVSGAAAGAVTAPGLVLASLLRQAGLSAPTLSERALQRLIQRASGAIASDYRKLSRDAEEALREALVRGMAEGKGPRDVARQMVDRARALAAARYGLTPEQVADLRRAGMAEDVVGEVRAAFNGGQQRALTLARTELVDASRAATTASYLASGQVVGWRWLCALDARTCPACWGMHNTVVDDAAAHQLGHQNCRCTQVPILRGEELGASDMGDPDAALRALLAGGGNRADLLRMSFGKQRLRYLAAGGSVRDMAMLRDNPGWRPAYVVKPLRDLLAA